MSINPIVEAGLVSLVIALSCLAAAFALLRRKWEAERTRFEDLLKEQQERLDNFHAQLEDYARRLAESEQRYAPAAEAAAFPASLHLNRRGQVVQLHRRGENVRNIACLLGMSQGEVKLMIKLHDINGAGALKKI